MPSSRISPMSRVKLDSFGPFFPKAETRNLGLRHACSRTVGAKTDRGRSGVCSCAAAVFVLQGADYRVHECAVPPDKTMLEVTEGHYALVSAFVRQFLDTFNLRANSKHVKMACKGHRVGKGLLAKELNKVVVGTRLAGNDPGWYVRYRAEVYCVNDLLPCDGNVHEGLKGVDDADTKWFDFDDKYVTMDVGMYDSQLAERNEVDLAMRQLKPGLRSNDEEVWEEEAGVPEGSGEQEREHAGCGDGEDTGDVWSWWGAAGSDSESEARGSEDLPRVRPSVFGQSFFCVSWLAYLPRLCWSCGCPLLSFCQRCFSFWRVPRSSPATAFGVFVSCTCA